jgi:hypothetical protein
MSISPVKPLYEDSLEWSPKEITEAKEISEDDYPDNLELDIQHKVQFNSAGLIWVPKKEDRREWMCAMAHSGLQGH